MSGLSPPVFATLFRQLLQRDTTLGATRGRRGLSHNHDCHAVYHPASLAMDARKHMDCRLPYSSSFPVLCLTSN